MSLWDCFLVVCKMLAALCVLGLILATPLACAAYFKLGDTLACIISCIFWFLVIGTLGTYLMERHT